MRHLLTIKLLQLKVGIYFSIYCVQMHSSLKESIKLNVADVQKGINNTWRMMFYKIT